MELRALLRPRLLRATASWFLAASLFAPAAAFADAAVGNGSPPASSNASATVFTGGTTTLKTGKGNFLGASNIGGTGQVSAVTCYDSPAAASGPVVFNGILGVNVPSWPSYPPPFVMGLTCSSTTLLGSGVQIYYR